MRKLGTAAIALSAVLLLSACNIITRVVVHPDGSGTYSLVLTAPVGATGDDPGPAILTQLRKAAAASNVPLHVQAYRANGESGARAYFDFRSLPDLKAESADLAAAGTGLNAVIVDRTGTGWHFASATVPGLAVPPMAQGAPGGPITATPLTGIVHVSIVVELPGAPGVNNATAVTRNATTSTFNWVVNVGQPAAGLQASTTFVGNQATVALASKLTTLGAPPAHGTSHVLPVLLIAGAAALLAGAAFLLLRRRRAGAAADPAGGAEPEAPESVRQLL